MNVNDRDMTSEWARVSKYVAFYGIEDRSRNREKCRSREMAMKMRRKELLFVVVDVVLVLGNTGYAPQN